MRTVVSVPNPNKILSKTFEKLKGLIPIELELYLKGKMYSIRAVTIPRMDKSLCVYSYLDKNTVHGYKQDSCFLNLDEVDGHIIHVSSTVNYFTAMRLL